MHQSSLEVDKKILLAENMIKKLEQGIEDYKKQLTELKQMLDYYKEQYARVNFKNESNRFS